MKRWPRLILALLLATGAIVATAFAAGSSLTLTNSKPGVYTGTVSSGNDKCEPNRKVIVRHDQNRNGYDRSDYKIGTDRTDAKGDYEVLGNQAPRGDAIAAKVAKKTLADGTVCKKATTRGIARAREPRPPR